MVCKVWFKGAQTPEIFHNVERATYAGGEFFVYYSNGKPEHFPANNVDRFTVTPY